MSTRRTVLFIGAHADDVEIGAGGTCARLCARGFDVHIVVLTDEAVAAVATGRRQEAIAAGAALGVHRRHVHFLGLSDGNMICNRQSVGALRALATQHGIKPIAVFTHTEADSHQDHIEATRIAKGAFREAAIFKYQVRNSAITSSFAPVVYCAVDQTYDAKMRALELHHSQMAVGRIPIAQIRQFDERRGPLCGGRTGEAFELEIQEGALAAVELIDILDSQPFRRLWSPVLASERLTVLAASDHRASSSDLIFVTRLQTALLGALPYGIGAKPAFRFEVALADGIADEAHAAAGSVLILGGPEANWAAAALHRWLGIPGFPTMDTHGSLTIAQNPIAARNGKRAYIFMGCGNDAWGASVAHCLLDDACIEAVLDCAGSVYSGRSAVVQVPVAALQAQYRGQPQAASEAGGFQAINDSDEHLYARARARSFG